jgi:hypothetical protein
MLNKKVLSKIDLGSYTKPNPFHNDIIYDPRGQWDHPGQNTRIPGEDITMQGIPYPVYAQPNVGQPQMMYPDQNYQFPGADYVDEFPQMKKGGRIKGLVSMPKPSKKGLMSNKYSRSLDATNKLFTENFLFAKPKSRKNKVFDPNAKYYAKGGALLTKEVTCKKCGWKWDAEDGGKDITTCHKCGGQGLVHAQDGGTYTVKGSKGVYKKVNGKWQVDWNRSGNYQPLSKGDVKARTAVLDKMAKPLYDKDYDEMVAYKNLSTKEKIKKFEPKKEATKEELKKVSERLGRDYKPEDTKLQSVEMVYPEKYIIGPGGGLLNQGLKTGVGAIEKLAATKIPGLFGTTVGQAAGAGFAADALVNQFPGAIRDIGKGEYENAAEKALYGTLGLAGSGIGKGVVSGAKDLSKFLGTESGVLSNAYKINPWAFKANPESAYRMIGGKEGYLDAINSGEIRAMQNGVYGDAHFNMGLPLNPNRLSSEELLKAGSPGGYKGPYMVERRWADNAWNKHAMTDGFEDNPEMFQALKDLGKDKDVWGKYGNLETNSNAVRLYKEHWWQGYKQVPKQLPGSPNVDFSKYLTQEEAIAARAERLISQKNKPGWNEQLTPELEQRLSTAVERHNPASDYPGEKLGSNTMGRTATEVSKDANLSGIPLNEANKARIAAHETGHYYSNSSAEGAEWLKPFNLNKLESYKTKTYLRGKNRSANYANEIRERAAQLKDYIAQKNGIPLNQDFKITQVQLDDAIKNYVKDTGLDNTMSKMLGALNDKKGLLKTMNKYALGTVPAAIGAETLQQKKQGGPTGDYIELDLNPEEIQRYKDGGYIVEDISIPSLNQMRDGGDNQSNGETYKYLGRPDSLYKKSLNGRWSISNKSTGDRFVYIEDPKGSRTKELNKNAVTVSSLNKKRRDHLIKLHKEINFPKEFVDLKDTRTIRATTGEKINPNVDLKADKYNKVVIDNIIKKSKAVGVDPSTMLAIALQETNFGKKDANLGHALYGDTAYPYGYIDFYKEKLNEAKRAKIDNELLQIQYYNGLGTVYPETEEDYHGFKMQKIYGVPLPASGINMRKNPLYGKQIIDLRDNVVLKNPYIQKALKEKKQGGTTNNYVDAELTPKEIKDLIAQGYVIEELN